FENPPVPHDLQELIADLQRQGAKWVINTGRDLSSVMEGIARARLTIRPDYLVVVEREIYLQDESQYLACEPWNESCRQAHADLDLIAMKSLPQETISMTSQCSTAPMLAASSPRTTPSQPSRN